MKIVFKQNELPEALKTLTYQSEFPKTLRCKRCRMNTLPFLVVSDDKGEIIEERPKNIRIFPHDSSTTVVYLCPNCGSMRAVWNQG